MQNIFKFTRPEDGVQEDVIRERWRWEAIYNDGTSLLQFDDQTGTFHRFAEIDQSKLDYFRLIHDEKPSVGFIFYPERMKLIHYYLNTVLDKGGENERYIKEYNIGWQTKSRKYIIQVREDDSILISDDQP
jgi:hypothetical protein